MPSTVNAYVWERSNISPFSKSSLIRPGENGIPACFNNIHGTVKNAVRLIPAISAPYKNVLLIPPSENRLSSGLRGGRAISLFPSFLSTPSASAGSESVIRFIQRIWLDLNGDGSPRMTAVNIVKISPRLEESRKITDFFIFS